MLMDIIKFSNTDMLSLLGLGAHFNSSKICFILLLLLFTIYFFFLTFTKSYSNFGL